MTTYPEIWNSLFADGAASETLKLKQVNKGGHPFLLLPTNSKAAAACLRLYPAQTPKARAARALLKGGVKVGLLLGLKGISLPFQKENKFVRFLETLVPQQELAIAERLGVLAGNPGGTGQRLVILLFDKEFEPARVVKVGLMDNAKALITDEREILKSLPTNALGKPELVGAFDSEQIKAMAMPFYPGKSPVGEQTEKIFALLGSWLSRSRTSPIVTTELWRRLKRAAGNDGIVKTLDVKLSERETRLAIWHGDFAPWNIKVLRDRWVVLDWERGELNGIPGWDWFHYETQTAILARKESTQETMEKIEALLGTRFWRDYARMAQIAAFQRELVMAYLAYQIHVIKPSEGLREADGLLRGLVERWKILKN